MADQTVPTFRRSFKYRLYPNKAQAQSLSMLLGAACDLYNAALEQRRTAWKSRKQFVGLYGQCAQIPEARKGDEHLKMLSAQACQNVLWRLQRAFDAFFSRVKRGENPGYPRFRGRDRYDSITFPTYGNGVKLADRLYVQNVGRIKIKLHRPVEGRIKTVTVRREAGKWYVIFSCDEVPARRFPEADAQVGIDVGLESFATLSTGEKVENPRWFRASEKRLAKAQRDLARKVRGSNRWRKARARVAKIHAKAKNQRKDFQHKLAHRIVSENTLIAVEDLEPQRMAERSPKGLSKSIMDAAWAQFFAFLAYKAEEAGRRFAKVPSPNTSKLTACCGEFVDLALGDRVIRCPRCRSVKDRDWNASLNILGLGRSLQAQA